MGTSTKIVHGGGWLVTQTVGRPKLRFFLWLSLIWLLVLLPGTAPFWDGWPETWSGLEWIGLLSIVPEPVFVALAVWYLFTERPRMVTEFERNPDHDLRNLY